MLSSGFGHVINILSIAGKFGTNSRTSYTTAKFGLMGMMDSLRWEVCVACHVMKYFSYGFVVMSCYHRLLWVCPNLDCLLISRLAYN